MDTLTISEAAVLDTPSQSTALGNFADTFREKYKVAASIAKSGLIPAQYQNKVEDCAIAIDMADRMGVSPMMVMQNLYVVKGKPSWSGQSCIAILKNKYSTAEPVYFGEKGTDSRGCYFKIGDISGPEVTMAMAKSEGWTSNSKWKNMPELMLAYRAAAFCARIYCPEILMGMHVEGEIEDITPEIRKGEDVL